MAKTKKVTSYSGWASGRCVVVGISGGIAAYKIPGLVNQLKYEGAEIHVIMTSHATKFITPMTLQVLSQNPVQVDMFETSDLGQIEHIDLADRADVLVVAPATANILGKVAGGIADDLLTSTIMSTTSPVLFCPAMNVHMYENQIVQENIQKLKKLKYRFVDPEVGALACGYEGRGRLADQDVMLRAIRRILDAPRTLSAAPIRSAFAKVADAPQPLWRRRASADTRRSASARRRVK